MVLQSGNIIPAGHIARMGEMRNAYAILVGNLKKIDFFVEGRVNKGMLKEIFKETRV
jgi:hypothetical protein